MTKEAFDQLIGASSSKAFAIWRSPDEAHINILVDTGVGNSEFIIAPFRTSETLPYITLKGDTYAAQEIDFDLNPYAPASSFTGHSTKRADHLRGVQQVVKMISESELDKVVISTQTFTEGNYNVLEVFNILRAAYPKTFTHLTYHPQSGIWIGASPEPLVVQEDAGYLTASLAGTRTASNDIQAWGQKESLEQSIVTDYIKEQLVNAEATGILISRPETLRFGNIEHLKSDIRFESSAISKVLNYLHPTPAVAGTPLNSALTLLDKIESHDRMYYTGYIGCNGVNLPARYFVNLRCLKFYSNGLLFFTGGGITLDSEPDSEWLETRDKLDSLLSHIKKL
ncbi:MAG: isochorismate synthase [Flavobacteriales bacterium]|jgi:isochorismate synthase